MAQEPSVKMGKPFDSKSFNSYTIDDIDVYVEKGMKSKNDEITIGLSKVLWLKSLNVSGISYS